MQNMKTVKKQAFFNIYIIFTENPEKVEKFNQVQDSPKTHGKQSRAEMKNRNVIDRRFLKILKLTPEMAKTWLKIENSKTLK